MTIPYRHSRSEGRRKAQDSVPADSLMIPHLENGPLPQTKETRMVERVFQMQWHGSADYVVINVKEPLDVVNGTPVAEPPRDLGAVVEREGIGRCIYPLKCMLLGDELKPFNCDSRRLYLPAEFRDYQQAWLPNSDGCIAKRTPEDGTQIEDLKIFDTVIDTLYFLLSSRSLSARMTCQFRSGRKRALFGYTFVEQGASPSHW
ncbi:hypothetical protein C8R45DRAFT_935320 [Mycena sanguinolenta]|nr:hypothetical protein C8R45DRAFT_935320 [Mycena sanguinolenta]